VPAFFPVKLNLKRWAQGFAILAGFPAAGKWLNIFKCENHRPIRDQAARSKMPAAPMPPPTHMVTKP
jgi:hypothetical protein